MVRGVMSSSIIDHQPSSVQLRKLHTSTLWSWQVPECNNLVHKSRQALCARTLDPHRQGVLQNVTPSRRNPTVRQNSAYDKTLLRQSLTDFFVRRRTSNESTSSCDDLNVVATARLICLTLRSCWMSPTTGCSARFWTVQLTHCIHSSLHSPQHRSTTIWDDARTTDSCQHKLVTCVKKLRYTSAV